MPDVRPNDPASIAFRALGWMLLTLGLAAGVVLPAPVTTRLWTGASLAFGRGGDARMVLRLTSATKFGPRIRQGLAGQRVPRRVGGVAEAF